MCGVTGFLNLSGEPATEVFLKPMLAALVHRGPDGEGCYVDRSVALGHRRLAILDLSEAGRQPMVSKGERFVLSFNGCIYNFRELRKELQDLGYEFRSQSDTEVFLEAFAEWGVQSLNRLNGMFAFALWDREQQNLYFGRDRYGIKPLYYFHTSRVFIFASEIKSILEHPSYRVQMDTTALYEYCNFQNYFGDSTLFKGVKLFPPGHWGVISSKEERPVLKKAQFWDYSFQEPTEGRCSYADYKEELVRLFRQAVLRQSISDVEIATYLSSGVDSGSITAVASQLLDSLKTFTVGFDLRSASGIELGFDERDEAEHLSYLLGTEQYEVILKAGDLERCLHRLSYHLEEPRIGQSYPNYYASKLASRFVKVILTGTGGDEMFGGYPWRYYRSQKSLNFDEYIKGYLNYWQRIVPEDVLPKMFKSRWREVDSLAPWNNFCSVFSNDSLSFDTREDVINAALYFEAKTFLHSLLIVEDKLSMSHGLESRVPFLDNDLVDFSMSLPVALKLGSLTCSKPVDENISGNKVRDYFIRTNQGKLILRDALKTFVPEITADRMKQGFSGPDASWFRGESIEFIRRRLLSNSSPLFDFLDRDEVHKLVLDHVDGKKNRRLFVWSMLSLDQMIREFGFI